MLSALLAVLAAVANALGSVLQRKEARDRPASESLNWRLIWNLVQRPVWLGGIGALTTAFLLQATALSNGQISVVESLLVLDLPIALVLSSLILHGRRMRWREWGAAAVMAGGLAALLLSLSPSAGSSSGAAGISGPQWAAAVGANVLLVAIGVCWAKFATEGVYRAAVLGATASCGFGLTAALIKGATGATSHGVGAVFTTWQLYAMIVSGAGSMFLMQSAIQAGPLLAAQPGLSLGDPVISILWGILLFGEQVRGGLHLLLAGAAAAVMVAAVVVLARSPLLANESGQSKAEESDAEESDAEESDAGESKAGKSKADESKPAQSEAAEGR